MKVESLRKLFSLRDAIHLEPWSPVVIEMTWLGAAAAYFPPSTNVASGGLCSELLQLNSTDQERPKSVFTLPPVLS